MPHITTAMQRSVRRSIGDILLNSMIGRRDVTGEINNVKTTFTTWSGCMAKTYCKWPVIIGMVVGGLILFSILWCIIRCACCGMSCCCTCFSFLKCCDCCGGCCDGKKNKPHKHLDDPYSHPLNQGYKAQSPMMAGGMGASSTGPPQYAQFEVGKSGLAVEPKPNISEDALPPMPSWESATKKHVQVEEEKNAVELGELDPVTGQKVPLMTGAAATGVSKPPSPVHDLAAVPHGQRPGQSPSPVNDIAASPYGQRPGQPPNHSNDMVPGPYGQRPGQSPSHANNMGATPYGQRPGQDQNAYMGVATDQYGQQQDNYNQNGRRDQYSQQNPNGYNQNGRGYRGPPQGPGMGRGYGPNTPQDMEAGQGRSYSPQEPYGNNNEYIGTAVSGGYNRPPPQRQYTNDNSRPYPPQPVRQYSSDSARPLNPGRQYSDRNYQDNTYPDTYPSQNPPRGPSRGPGGRIASPPLNNNSGFDFGTQQQPPYPARTSPPPQQNSYNTPYQGSTAPPSYASRSPPPQDMGYQGGNQNPSANGNRNGNRNGNGNGGYRPYQQPPMNQGRGQRDPPQNWDPVHR